MATIVDVFSIRDLMGELWTRDCGAASFLSLAHPELYRALPQAKRGVTITTPILELWRFPLSVADLLSIKRPRPGELECFLYALRRMARTEQVHGSPQVRRETRWVSAPYPDPRFPGWIETLPSEPYAHLLPMARQLLKIAALEVYRNGVLPSVAVPARLDGLLSWCAVHFRRPDAPEEEKDLAALAEQAQANLI